MFKQVFAEAGFVFGPSLALVLFFLVMCGSIFWVYRKGSKSIYQRAAALPLIHDTESGVSQNG